MKKFLGVLVCFLVPMSIMAVDGLKLKKGDSSILRKPVKATLVFDYSKAEIEGKDQMLDEYIEQKGYKFESKWETANSMAYKEFIKQFNKKSVGMQFSTDSLVTEEYRMTILIRAINLGNAAKSLIPIGRKTDGGVTIYGRIIIQDSKGKEECVLSFSNIQGLGTATLETRMVYAFQALRSAIIHHMKKTIKNDEEISQDDTSEE